MDTVIDFERERLLDAMLEETMDKGHRAADVEAAMPMVGPRDRDERRAGAPDRERRLFGAYDQLIGRLRRTAIAAAAASEGSWPERVGRGLEALCDELAAKPPLAEAVVSVFPSTGSRARDRYQAFVEGFAPLLREGRELAEAELELPAEVELLAVGAAEALILQEVRAGRAERLPELAPEILFSLLAPFLGPAAAAAEMERAREAGLEVA